MRIRTSLLPGLLGCLFVLGLAVAPAHAQATRTWVSGVGDDANPCSRTAPCKTWPGAISKTAPGGEIDALDPGGFGALTIAKSITIDGGGGQVASTLVAGTNGFVISANIASDVVIIRNMRFDGLLGGGNANAGLSGILIQSASRVVIENCDIFGFGTAGISVAPNAAGTINVKVQNTTLNNDTTGITTTAANGATINLQIDRSRSDNNTGGGIKMTGLAGAPTNVSIVGSSFSLNGGNGLNAVSNGGNVNVDVTTTVFGQNGSNGVQANQGAGGAAVVTVGNSILSNNVTAAWNPVSGATILSFKNNQVTGPVGTVPGTASFQ
jgi:Right handed beta helix region